MIEPDYIAYRDYFEEILPFKGSQLKHTYRVEVVRACYDQKSFDVFKKYEASIHGKQDK